MEFYTFIYNILILYDTKIWFTLKMQYNNVRIDYYTSALKNINYENNDAIITV